MSKDTLDELLNKMSGIRLDIGCGANKQPGFVGMDKRELPGVEIVHDWEEYPWPIPDETCLMVLASHVVEHVNPTNGQFIRWMDELWRICKIGAEVMIAHPHGSSQGFLQDPTHCNPLNETSWAYFAPKHPSKLWTIYKPKPWKIKNITWNPTFNVEVVLIKLEQEEEAS